jgi:BirA family biotin operon repressor/biotin-[acetyl-CoA-carboxylase] ligase
MAIAVGQAIGLPSVQYKWPNDIMINNKKLCGILIETLVGKSIIIGVGVNIKEAPLESAIALKDYIEITSIDLLKKIITSFDAIKRKWVNDGFSFIKEAWNESAFKINKPVVFKQLNENYKGILSGIDDFGALIIKDDSGVEKKFYSGDLCVM